MANQSLFSGASWSEFFGPNYGYVLELYEQYLQDPASVDATVRDYFDHAGAPERSGQPYVEQSSQASSINADDIRIVVAAVDLARNIREFGHRGARVNALAQSPSDSPLLQTESYGITEADLKTIPAQWVWRKAPSHLHTAADVIAHLRKLYSGTLAYDFGHVNNAAELNWLTNYVESETPTVHLTSEEKRSLWYRLLEVEQFEKFLHRTFVGQKRFSIEGLDVLVPMLDWLIERAVARGTRYVSMGMAHRGRLNVLAHVLRKPYDVIFSEFHASPNKDLVPSEGSMGINYGWTGDVKYHLGAHRTVDEGDLVEARLMLANNPSHLEFVDPVVVGSTRAAQDDRTQRGTPHTDPKMALAVLVHGDAAFPGEGVVAETLNMSQLPGYQVGGVIHIIANNQLGFTAESHESRSTRYASDLAKGFEIPVVHVSADDPESCVAAVLMAYKYREQFHKDFLIDLIGYRRWGHNEMDDPAATQPVLYAAINSHRGVRELYQDELTDQGVLTKEEGQQGEARVQKHLQDAYSRVQKGEVKPTQPQLSPVTMTEGFETGVSADLLRDINQQLLEWPSSFTVYPKLQRILERRAQSLADNGKVDWATAETLAFTSILSDGTAIRLTGQDTERGTFGHRHLVLHDYKTGERHIPIAHVKSNRASFDVHNSPLSETGPLGFEYGYDIQAKDTLVLWEAQFGDFANVAQVIIDQFIVSGRSKWGQESGIVLLLPHGYEGQGPEHSSGRLERFLQLSAENSWVVANVTSAAQYFHLLRVQAMRLQGQPCPLVVMTPKSLLRNPHAASPWQQLVEGRFHRVLGETPSDPNQVSRVIFCSGKIAIDLEHDSTRGEVEKQVQICRVEQLYPFPHESVQAVLQALPNVKEVVWVQEEPKNMGAWGYIEPHLRAVTNGQYTLRYVGRAAHASPAEGVADVHQHIQSELIQTALGRELTQEITEF